MIIYKVVFLPLNIKEMNYLLINRGDGLNQGYTAKPSGGHHPDEKYVMPKSADELS